MSLLEQLQIGVETESPEATEEIARELAAHIPENTILALHGELGAGKTTFIRGLARAWEIKESITSPTFNLYTVYQGQRQLIHLDAYRLADGSDLDALMIEDFLSPPWCFAVEWPERIADALLASTWHLQLEITSDKKHLIRLLASHPSI